MAGSDDRKQPVVISTASEALMVGAVAHHSPRCLSLLWRVRANEHGKEGHLLFGISDARVHQTRRCSFLSHDIMYESLNLGVRGFALPYGKRECAVLGSSVPVFPKKRDGAQPNRPLVALGPVGFDVVSPNDVENYLGVKGNASPASSLRSPNILLLHAAWDVGKVHSISQRNAAAFKDSGAGMVFSNL